MLLSLCLRVISCDHSLSARMHQRRQAEHLLEIATLSFPRKDRMLGCLKGASGGIASQTLGACLEPLPDHADRGFPAVHAGLFRLRAIDRTGITLVNDTATMILCGIGRMLLNISRVAYRALES
jgi:hypothetical protein